MVGHLYIVYALLLQGCTTILYEGKPVGTLDAGASGACARSAKVNVLFTAPTAFRAIKKEDPSGALVKKYDMSAFRMLFLAGERGDPDTIEWAGKILGVPVIDNWWQTGAGLARLSNCMGIEPLPVRPGSPTRRCPASTSASSTRRASATCGRRHRQPGDQVAAAARQPDHAVEQRRRLRRDSAWRATRATTCRATPGISMPTATAG
ncbi:MAG: AMP-binding protein [Ottowia sp.]